MSLAVQQGVRVEIVIMTQSFKKDNIDMISEWCDANIKFFPAVSNVIIRNIGGENNSEDIRSKLLNEGVKIASSQYLAFLDDDDLMYHYAYKQLIHDLISANAVAAFGRCVRVEGEYKGATFHALSKSTPYNGNSIIDLIVDNFCPIHSYVLDIKAIDINEVYFDEDLPYLEDYRLLIRLMGKYKFTFLSMSESVCEYWFYQNNLNTTNKSSNRFSKEAEGWRKAYAITEKLKSETKINVSLIDIELWARNRIYNNIPNDVIIDSAYHMRGDLILSGDMFVK